MSYTPDVYEAAEEELEKRRMRSEYELEKRREILFARSPRAGEIERTIARTSVAAAKAIFAGADAKPRLEALRDQNLALQSELTNIIKSFGFPENYLDPWHKCDKCADRGYINGWMCDCMKRLLRQISYDRLNEMSPLELSGFDGFSLEHFDKAPDPETKKSPYAIMSGNLEYCRRYARKFSTSSQSLLFQGPPGLGKTHLSLAIAREVIEAGFGVIYVSAPALLTKLGRETFDFGSRSAGNTEQLITECDLLIIDDLGTEFSSRFTVSAVHNVINTRMTVSKPTIISTNLTLSELEEMYNMRIISRIIGGLKRIVFVGTDYRQIRHRQTQKKTKE